MTAVATERTSAQQPDPDFRNASISLTKHVEQNIQQLRYALHNAHRHSRSLNWDIISTLYFAASLAMTACVIHAKTRPDIEQRKGYCTEVEPLLSRVTDYLQKLPNYATDVEDKQAADYYLTTFSDGAKEFARIAALFTRAA